MNREEYVKLRNKVTGVNEIVYNYYVEICKIKSLPHLPISSFIFVFSMWSESEYYVQNILNELDAKYEIILIIKNPTKSFYI